MSILGKEREKSMRGRIVDGTLKYAYITTQAKIRPIHLREAPE
jgi:hypothetical protein